MIPVQAFPLPNGEPDIDDPLGFSISELTELIGMKVPACEGGLLVGNHHSCTEADTGRHHVCSVCKAELRVPKDRARVIQREDKNSFSNEKQHSFWKMHTISGCYHLVNHVKRCKERPIVIWERADAIPDTPFQPLPEEWCDGDHLLLEWKHGTFVPKKAGNRLHTPAASPLYILPL